MVAPPRRHSGERRTFSPPPQDTQAPSTSILRDPGMRILSILPILAATLLAAPLAAQDRGTPDAVASIVQPLPVELAPRAIERAAVGPTRGDQLELGLVTGMLVGMAVGGVYRSLTWDDRDCSPLEEECMSREMETVLFALIGGSLGGIIGGGTSYLLNRPRSSRTQGLRVAPAADGGMRVGVMLRH